MPSLDGTPLFGTTVVTADPFFGETSDDSVSLIQWCEQTLTSKPGYLRTAPEQGCDLAGLLVSGLTAAAQVSLPAMAKAALERGRRVSSATVTLVKTALGGGKIAVALDIQITPSTGGPDVSFTHTVDPALADYMIKGA